MKRVLLWIFVLALVPVLCYPLSLAVIALASPPPLNVGSGTLDLCPATPNCVSSQETRSDWFVPPLQYSGDAVSAQARLVDALRTLPRTMVVLQSDGYVYAERRSPTFRFVDDLEFKFDTQAGVIHVRSASRLGQSDAGVNRAHIEAIRALFP